MSIRLIGQEILKIAQIPEYCSTNLGVSAISMECVKNWNKSKNFPYFFFVHQMNLFIMNGGLLPKLVSYFL